MWFEAQTTADIKSFDAIEIGGVAGS